MIRFLTGQISENAFFDTVMSPDNKKEAGRRCQAWFYAVSKRLIAHDKTKAAELTFFEADEVI